MQRRSIIKLMAASAAIGWPMRVASQGRVPVVALLQGRLKSRAVHLTGAFRLGLEESGFVDGQNVEIVERYAEGNFDRLPDLARELVQRGVAVLAAGWPSGHAA